MTELRKQALFTAANAMWQKSEGVHHSPSTPLTCTCPHTGLTWPPATSVLALREAGVEAGALPCIVPSLSFRVLAASPSNWSYWCSEGFLWLFWAYWTHPDIQTHPLCWMPLPQSRLQCLSSDTKQHFQRLQILENCCSANNGFVVVVSHVFIPGLM